MIARRAAPSGVPNTTPALNDHVRVIHELFTAFPLTGAGLPVGPSQGEARISQL